MRIPEQTVRQIQQTADILEVVQDFVSVKKKGNNYWGCCPFHHEKTPSFSVSPQKGFYKCFGCGKAGDSVKFVMEVESLSYVEALRYLAKKYSIEIVEQEETPAQQQAQQWRESLLIALQQAQQHFHELLLRHDEGRGLGLSYFKERGFTTQTIETFGLGYSLDAWDHLYNTLITKGFQAKVIEEAGLATRREDGKVYDRFRGRVMFPIHNISGRVIGFGARVLKKDDKTAKYLNSPETEVYHKSQVLYGLFQAKNAIRNADNCYLVEGYTDVISLHQAGIQNVVASSGTSLTEEQVLLIRRFSENVTILYDGDPAGIKAALRGIDLILEKGLNVRVVLFPDQDDPDSYVRKVGGEAFKAFITEKSQDFILFKTELRLAEARQDPIKRADAVRDVVESIARIPDPIKRRIFYKECAALMGLPEESLVAEGNKIAMRDLKNRQKEAERQAARQAPDIQPAETANYLPEDALMDEINALLAEASEMETHFGQVAEDPEILLARQHILTCEREWIRILISYGHEPIHESLRLCDYLFEQTHRLPVHTELHRRVVSHYHEALAEGVLPDEQYFLRQIPEPDITELVIQLITDRGIISENWQKRNIFVPQKDEMLHHVARASVLRLKYWHLSLLRTEAMQQLFQAELDQEMDLLAMIRELNRQIKVISDELGSNVRG